MSTYIQQAEALGYAVTANEFGGFRLAGFGVNTLVIADDDHTLDEAWQMFLDPAAHAGRVAYLEPPTDEEVLAVSRSAKLAEIQQELAKTGVWIERAFEEGIALPEQRKAYREQLRELLLQTKTSSDPAAIEVPAAPGWVPTTS